MQTLISNFLSIYFLVGYIVTAYVVILFFITGRHIFYGVKGRLSVKYKFGYVIAMILIMPVLYLFLLREIGMLHRKSLSERSHSLSK